MGYQVIRRLGRGGMGVVDLAVDDDGQPVALKRLSLHGSAADMARARQRVRREAEMLQGLDHPAIVALLDVVDDGDDVVLVMPHLTGGSLVDRVAERGPVPPGEVATLGDELLSALAAAHRQGVVHRDVKPANVLFDEAGRAHLADFGAARPRDATPGLTGTNLVVGTPGYMAPEQAQGQPATAASDVFSLGATLAFAATGTPPFGTGDPAVLMHRAATGRIERLPRHLPVELRRRLAPLLERNPARRPTAAAALAGPAGPAGTAVRGAVTVTPTRRRVVAGIAALALVLGAGAGVWALTSDESGDTVPFADLDSDERASADDCEPLPYQRCGEEPAPGTDGRRCVNGRADYDDDPANGCEAIPDDRDGTELVDRLGANLVPASDVDTYPFDVADRSQLFCDGTVTVTLTGPAGVGQRLELLAADGEVLGEVTSFDGETRSLSLEEPSCGSDDSTTLEARVSWAGDGRSADDYTLEVDGSF